MITKPRAEDFLAQILFNNDDRRVMLVDSDDLVKQFGAKAANRMLDALVPDPEPRPKDWIVETWAARGSVGLGPGRQRSSLRHFAARRAFSRDRLWQTMGGS
jgi:hypothetical protein